VNGAVITFTPDAQLNFASSYRVDVRYRVLDLVGNNRWNGDYYFTTQ